MLSWFTRFSEFAEFTELNEKSDPLAVFTWNELVCLLSRLSNALDILRFEKEQ